MAEGEALIDCILENTPPLEPLRVEPELKHEKVSSAEAEPVEPIKRPSPEPEDLEESFQPLDLPYFEDDFFENSETPRSTHVKIDHQFLSLLRTP